MVSTVLWILLLLAALLVGIVFGVLAATTHVDGVPLEGTVKGVLLAAALGAVPAYLLYELGRALGRRPVVLGLVCLALTAPLGFLYFAGWIVVLDHAHCTPDAYECPF
jgi:hypothetical protein